MSKPVILSIDQGTTSSRAMLFSLAGEPLASAQQEYQCSYPHDGWVEQQPSDVIDSVNSVCGQVVQESKSQDLEIISIGITNQRETTIIWDRKTHEPVYSAIVWQDRRTNDYCQQLKEMGKEDDVRQRTGLLLDPYFSATKIAWILNNVDGVRARAERGELAFGTIDSYLMYKMSDGKSHVTDITNASRTLLFNINTRSWDDSLLALFTIPKSLLPEVKPSDAHFTNTNHFGLERPIPVQGCAGDQQAAAFGQGCFAPGESKATYGTGCFIVMNAGTKVPNAIPGLLTTIGFQLRSQNDICDYAYEGSIFNAGTAVQWLRDEMKIIKDAQEIEPLAQSVSNSSGVYFVPAFTGLGAPYWDSKARGTICGLTRGAGSAHLARAALDSVAYQTNDIMELFDGADCTPKQLNVDGGMTVNSLAMQKIANLTNVPVSIAAVPETTALGAAFLALIGSGNASTTEEVTSLIKTSHSCSPQLDPELRKSKIAGWKRAVKSAVVFSHGL